MDYDYIDECQEFLDERSRRREQMKEEKRLQAKKRAFAKR